MYTQTRGGTRGGAAEFKWSDVSADKDRENYLGHSINAPTGRWQKNKDVHWYAREAKDTEAERREEIRKIKEAEEDALAVALGFAPANRSAISSASSTAKDPAELEEESAKKAAEKEKRRLKEEKRLKKETKRAQKATEKDRRSERLYDWSRTRSRSPIRDRSRRDRPRTPTAHSRRRSRSSEPLRTDERFTRPEYEKKTRSMFQMGTSGDDYTRAFALLLSVSILSLLQATVPRTALHKSRKFIVYTGQMRANTLLLLFLAALSPYVISPIDAATPLPARRATFPASTTFPTRTKPTLRPQTTQGPTFEITIARTELTQALFETQPSLTPLSRMLSGGPGGATPQGMNIFNLSASIVGMTAFTQAIERQAYCNNKNLSISEAAFSISTFDSMRIL
ncbi:hypothetical protein FRB96_001769 [Tulasnella sp. 330]|nr:hypothetical protein FRB96_001769 [Tulasnella sp. 330]